MSAFDRESIAWIRERDVDLLLTSELHDGGRFGAWLFEALGRPGTVFRGAWVSVSDETGESDLRVDGVRADGASIVLLIENKIAASFQPEQDARYAIRARRLAESGGVAEVRTVLMAPGAYLEGASAAFDARLAYEVIADWLEAHGESRAKFFARTLRAGVEAQRRGYVAVRDETVSRFWEDYYRVAAADFPALRMAPPGGKPAGSSFIYFRGALPALVAGRRADIVHKFAHGWVDLQFRDTAPEDLEALRPRLPPDCVIARANNSASVRRHAPPLNPATSFAAQEAAARLGLAAAEDLRAWAASLDDL